MTSPHEDGAERRAREEARLIEEFRYGGGSLPPGDGTFGRLRRRAAARRRTRVLGAGTALAACLAAAAVLVPQAAQDGQRVVTRPSTDVSASAPRTPVAPTPSGSATTPRAPDPEESTPRSGSSAPTKTPGREAAPTERGTRPPAPEPSASEDEGEGTSDVPACASARLSASVDAGDSGAGSRFLPLRLTNTGPDACSLRGFPGVSLVAGADGGQVGAAAVRDGAVPAGSVVLLPNGSAIADVRIGQAGTYSEESCDPRPAKGLRVYPPGQRAALFVPLEGVTGCASQDVTLLGVRAVRAVS